MDEWMNETFPKDDIAFKKQACCTGRPSNASSYVYERKSWQQDVSMRTDELFLLPHAGRL
jgi:hypothetical protein